MRSYRRTCWALNFLFLGKHAKEKCLQSDYLLINGCDIKSAKRCLKTTMLKVERLRESEQQDVWVRQDVEKIRLTEGNAKCCRLKKLTCKGTLRQAFIRVYKLEVANFLCKFNWYFHPSFGICISCVAPLPFSMVQLSPLPPSLPCVNKYTVYTYSV